MTVSSPNPPAETVDRASGTDLAFLAMDAGGVPEQFAAVLVLAADAPVDGAAVEDTLAERVAAVPRLRQRLVRTPVGCGRRIWVDDAAFDARHHLRRLACRAPGDETALLELATNLVVDPLPRDRPLWRAAYVTGLAGGRTAPRLVLHHALADGIGGFAILAELADDAAGTPVNGFPRPVPSPGTLAADALRGRLRSLRRATLTWRRSWTAMSAAGGLIPPRAAACSLIAPTGPRRRAAVASADAGR